MRGDAGEEDMYVSIIGDRVHVRLSRRNLRQLGAIIFDNQEAHERCLARKEESGVSLIVQVEDDADHYEGRDAGPGLGEVAHQPQEANHP
jgi:hypothetical protein